MPRRTCFSPMMAYEGLTAFFLESTFLGVLLFGRRLVPAWAHFFAGLMVAFGTLLSSFWILSANSWMQTPQGYKLVDGPLRARRLVSQSASIRRFRSGCSTTHRLLHHHGRFLGHAEWRVAAAPQPCGRGSAMMIRMALNLLSSSSSRCRFSSAICTGSIRSNTNQPSSRRWRGL